MPDRSLTARHWLQEVHTPHQSAKLLEKAALKTASRDAERHWTNPASYSSTTRLLNAAAIDVDAVRVKPSAYIVLWVILITVLLCGTACLWCAGLQADFGSALIFVEAILLSLLTACMFFLLSQALRGFRVVPNLAVMLQDFFFSIAQLMTALVISGLLIYLAAYVGATFPMRDDSLEYFDRVLGYDWRAMSHWLYTHPMLDGLLLSAYDSLDIQIFLLIFIISLIYPGRRNCEFTALFMVSIILKTMAFTFVPAFGMFGKADVATFDRLLDIRSGSSFMTYNCTASIINFPSYHTVLAILVPYSARHRCWFFLPTLLVDIVMLAATSPEGGHYLVDMLAGAAVAAASILVVRRWIPCYEAGRVHSLRIDRLDRPVEIVGPPLPVPSSKGVWVR